jgi:hypothetical protein
MTLEEVANLAAIMACDKATGSRELGDGGSLED